jgi:hypothetical protein
MAENEDLAAALGSDEEVSADVARVEAEVHDEIDGIMAEIEKIKATMVASPSDLKGAGVEETGAEPVAEAEMADTARVDAEVQAEAEPVTAEVDFGQGNTDAPIEDTLGSMAVEEVSGGLLSGDAETMAAPPPVVHAKEPEPQVATPFVPKIVRAEVSAASAEPSSPPVVQKVNGPAQMGGSPAQSGMLSMTLTGSMKLALKYEMDGQEVTIGFDSQFLHLSLADGSEFKIPVARERRKAA